MAQNLFYHNILEVLAKYPELNLKNMISYSADNAPVNYGVRESVFTFLKQDNLHIFKGDCHCHILHNTAKFACRKLQYDVEVLVLKMYAEFSTSAKKLHNYKNFLKIRI
jgi:hypothetical protein